MSDRDHREEQPATEALSEGEIEALAAWTVPEPPPGFADRVLAARKDMPVAPAASVAAVTSARPPARGRILPWVVVAAAAVVALFLVQRRSPSSGAGDHAGSAAPLERRSIRLGQRGVAVAEPGSSLSWEIEGGQARVAQQAGDVFYRVERGGTFEVKTAHGDVRVTGSCFRVELDAMKTPTQAVVGAAIGAAVVVTVYEGSVLLASRDGDPRAVEAGQVAVGVARGVRVRDRRSPAPPAADISHE